VGFKFDRAFIFGNVFEEYVNEDKLISLIPFMSIISKAYKVLCTGRVLGQAWGQGPQALGILSSRLQP
jgi:hypothetical protein